VIALVDILQKKSIREGKSDDMNQIIEKDAMTLLEAFSDGNLERVFLLTIQDQFRIDFLEGQDLESWIYRVPSETRRVGMFWCNRDSPSDPAIDRY
jgi:hypothetical protein